MSTIVSTSWVPAPLYACLKKADQRLGANRVWRGATEAQAEFLALYQEALGDLGVLSEDEFRTLLSEKAEEINDWLARNGFQIELDPLGPGEFGTAAIIRLSAEWDVQGWARELRMENGTTHPGVFMREDSFTGYQASNHPHPVACITGKNGSEWYITKADRSLEGLALYAHLRAIGDHLESLAAEELFFPKVDFDQQCKPEVMLGLTTLDDEGDPWSVTQCVQQTRIKMNELGGLAESAAAVGIKAVSIRMTPPPIRIDGPMWLWINKPDMELPLFTAQFGYDSLKDPGEIEFGKPVVG